MKTVMAVLVTAAITASGGYAAGDHWASQQQVNDLGQRVTKLEKANKAIFAYVGACFESWAPITQYGGGDTGGYAYYPPEGDPFTTSALDVTQESDTAGFYVPAPSADCSLNTARLLGSSRHAFRVSRQISTRRR